MVLWSAGAVARMLGVSPTTLRTWDRRYGLGPSTREEGRHRRYSEDDVLRLRRMLELTGRGVAPAAAAALAMEPTEPGTGGADVARPGGGTASPDDAHRVDAEAARGFARAAFRLDLPLMTSLARDLVTRDGVVGAWQRVLVPFLVDLGEKVAARGSGVEVEHLATEAILGALRHRGDLAVSGRLPALLSCAPDEQHSLPLHVLGAALAERGCASRNLGPRVPGPALLDAVKLLAPRVVVLWAHRADLADLAPVPDLLERGQHVVLGGPGWGAAPSGARWVGSLREAIEAVLELNRF